MRSGTACDKYEVREIIDNSLSKLKDWLDLRLRQQHEDLLRNLSNNYEFANNRPGSQKSVYITDESVSHITPLTEYADVNNIFHLVHQNTNLEDMDTAVQMIKPAVMQTNDAQSDGSLEDVALPGMTGNNSDPIAQKKNVSGVSGQSTSDTTGHRSKEVSVRSLHSVPDIPDNQGQPPDRMTRMGTCTSLATMKASKRSKQRSSASELHLQEWQSKLMDIFDQLDLDGSGSIDTTEFMEAFEDVGLPEVQGLTVFKAFDKTQNGCIDRLEWLSIVEEAASGSDGDLTLLVDFLDRLAIRQQKQGAVFDTNRTRSPFCLLRHDSVTRMAWDMLLMVLLFYVSVSVPYSLGLGSSDILDTMDRITDCFFCCDLVLNFRTSFVDRDDTVIFDNYKIAVKYLKSWFLLDFVSSVPFDLVTAGLIPNLTPARLMKIGKIAKVIKLMRLSKMMALAESELMEVLDKKLGGRAHTTFARICRLAAITFLLAHWLACFGNAVDRSSLDNYFDGLAEEPPSAPQRYLAAMYWAMTTLSTVGYGDITPKSDAERAYAMMAMMVGGSLYGYVIGCVTSIVTETDLNANAFRERMERFQAWLGRHDEIPRVLRVRLKKHFERAMASQSAMDDASVVLDLSPELRAESAFFLVDSLVRVHPMFCEIPNSALAKLVEVLHKSHVSTKEYIVRLGDPGIAMYILVSGTARYDQGIKWQPPDVENHGKRFARVVEGDSFGEEIIFGLAETYSYTICTISDCEFHAISEDGFQERYQNMPELRVQMYSAFLRSRGMSNADLPRPTQLADRCRTLAYSSSVRHLMSAVSTRQTVAPTSDIELFKSVQPSNT